VHKRLPIYDYSYIAIRTWDFARDRCYDLKNIFAKNFGKKIGVFDSKQS
jgi:hypothetical protein